VLGRGGALASTKFVHGLQPCSEPQCSAAALPSSPGVGAQAKLRQRLSAQGVLFEECAPLRTHEVQSCLESLSCAPAFAQKPLIDVAFITSLEVV